MQVIGKFAVCTFLLQALVQPILTTACYSVSDLIIVITAVTVDFFLHGKKVNYTIKRNNLCQI